MKAPDQASLAQENLAQIAHTTITEKEEVPEEGDIIALIVDR